MIRVNIYINQDRFNIQTKPYEDNEWMIVSKSDLENEEIYNEIFYNMIKLINHL